jgi:hypothetical protein
MTNELKRHSQCKPLGENKIDVKHATFVAERHIYFSPYPDSKALKNLDHVLFYFKPFPYKDLNNINNSIYPL